MAPGLLLFFALFSAAPAPQAALTTCAERARLALPSLEADNPLRRYVERGLHGDCVRRPWMDGMRRFGVKHASFLVRYKITKDRVSLKVVKTSLFRRYYRYGDDDAVMDARVLREIRKSGLERKLRAAVVERLKAEWVVDVQRRARDEGVTAGGELEASLLDDESLPVIDHIF